MKFIFSFKIHCLQMLQLFQTKDGPFFFIVTLVALFLLYHQNIFIPYIVLVTHRLSLFCNETLFCSFKIHCLQMLQLFQTKDGPILFIVTLVYTCHAFFALSPKMFYPIYCFGHSFAMKFFISFKIHCLQMLQLFQTRDGPFFFIVTLVYTCHAFFALSPKMFYPIYCFGHSPSQSVSQ